MSIDYWAEYFGPSDAGAEAPESISNYFYETDVLDRMKIDERDSGVSIVIGVKGSGKTAICKMIEFTRQQRSIVWKIDKTYCFDSTQAGKETAGIEGLLVALLISGVLEQIRKNSKDFTKRVRSSIKDSVKNVRSVLGGIVKATKVGYGPIELDLAKISANQAKELSRIPIEVYKKELTKYLEEKSGYILMDDVDEVFHGCDSNSPFLEGLIEAVNTINLEFGPFLHCILFLRSGPYWSYRREARGYDKTRRIIGTIKWTHRELAELLAKRIRHIRGLTADEAVWETWAKEFGPSRKRSIEQVQQYILAKCPRGPRDVIDFCNLAKKEVPQGEITIQDLRKVEPKHSAEQLLNLNRDFGTEYPDIDQVLGTVFSQQKSVWSAGELSRLVNDRICANEKLRERFGKPRYLRTTYPAHFIEVMYDIGFIGYRNEDSPEFIYAMAEPEPAIEVASAFQHSIHPAYKSHLRLQ